MTALCTNNESQFSFTVVGQAMLPILRNGETIMMDGEAYRHASPRRGHIVVFRGEPAGVPDHFLARLLARRVIGLPGEVVAVHDGAVHINGRPLTEPYIQEPPRYVFRARRVPRGRYFVQGDNRNNSFDSSTWRTPWVARTYISGKVLI